MCGRKTLTRDMQSIIEELAIEDWQDPDSYFPSYNITPTQSSPILINDQRRTVKFMRWGLIPSWARDESIGSRMINARAETILKKPSFQTWCPNNAVSWSPMAIMNGKRGTGNQSPTISGILKKNFCPWRVCGTDGSILMENPYYPTRLLPQHQRKILSTFIIACL